MGYVPSLDFRPATRTTKTCAFVPKTICDFFREVSIIEDVSEKVSKLDGFVKGLEDEMRKIDAFKRQLPLCMFLLNDAIGALKEESDPDNKFKVGGCFAIAVQPRTRSKKVVLKDE